MAGTARDLVSLACVTSAGRSSLGAHEIPSKPPWSPFRPPGSGHRAGQPPGTARSTASRPNRSCTPRFRPGPGQKDDLGRSRPGSSTRPPPERSGRGDTSPSPSAQSWSRRRSCTWCPQPTWKPSASGLPSRCGWVRSCLAPEPSRSSRSSWVRTSDPRGTLGSPWGPIGIPVQSTTVRPSGPRVRSFAARDTTAAACRLVTYPGGPCTLSRVATGGRGWSRRW